MLLVDAKKETLIKTKKMKVGSSKQKINKKLTKKADEILDWDNKKSNPSIVKKIIKATQDENDFFNEIAKL